MSMNPFREPLAILLELRTASKERFSALVQEFGFSLLSFEQVPADAFGELLATLRSQEFIRRSDAWELVHVLPANWHMVSQEQQAALRPVLVEAFGRVSESTGAMVISEILGEFCCDDEALQQFASTFPARLRPNSGARSL